MISGIDRPLITFNGRDITSFNTAHGVIFTGSNVVEIKADRKTQTRRIIQLKTTKRTAGYTKPVCVDGDWRLNHETIGGAALGLGRCPYGQVGDRLWVREGWGISLAQSGAGWADGGAMLTYRADGEQVAVTKERFSPLVDTVGQLKSFRAAWRSPLHMPRWASRLTLEIIEVRVQRLQDISEGDALAEGISQRYEAVPTSHYLYGVPGEKCIRADGDRGIGEPHYPSAVEAYRALWESIHGRDSWAKNQWVWALTFRRIR